MKLEISKYRKRRIIQEINKLNKAVYDLNEYPQLQWLLQELSKKHPIKSLIEKVKEKLP